MSVVIAVRKGNEIVLASDLQSNFGDFTVPPSNHRASKVRKIGASLLGSTGWGLYDNILDDYLARQQAVDLADETSIFGFFVQFWKELHQVYSFVNDQCAGDESPFGDLDATFLVGSRRGIFYVSGNMSVSRFEQYFAIGSGADFALGALHALYSEKKDARFLARKAAEAALEFDTKCGGGIEFQKIKVRP